MMFWQHWRYKMENIDSLERAYTELVDEGISAEDLYIYHLLIMDDRAYNRDANDLSQIIDKVKRMRYNYYRLSLEEVINRVLEGEDDIWDDFN